MYRLYPSLSMEEVFQVYKYAIKKNPKFAIDVFAKGYTPEDVALFEKEPHIKKGTPVKFKFFALFLSLEGELTRHLNQFDFHIKPQMLQLVPPDTMYYFENITENTEVSILFFSEDYIKIGKQEHLSKLIHQLFEYHKTNIKPVTLSCSALTRVKNIYNEIAIELHEKKNNYLGVIILLILQLLFFLHRAKEDQDIEPIFQNQGEKIAYDYLQLVERNFLENTNVSDYARLLKITPKYLGEIIKKNLGKNANFYIQHRRLKEAQYLLKFTDMSLETITTHLGFSYQSEFTRFFRKYEAITPKQFRLQAKECFYKQ